ncbi:uncharacterized protein [Euphorbia lathyris]|uniref:uncharacterized protein n=1 Tax=Euphorbia lathyris TaxID=212925 RepID=UPI003313B64B
MDRASDSFVWRSLISVRSILLHGSLWRVGDGSNIKILLDIWVLSLPCGCPLVLKCEPPTAYVSSLIIVDIGLWNSVVVKACCFDEDAEAILNLPLKANATDRFFGRYLVMCPLCGSDKISLIHFLKFCARSRLRWKCAGLSLKGESW